MSDWYPTLEEYNPNISVEQWKELVLDKEIFTKESLITFACLSNEKESSCIKLSEKFGRTKNFYNNGNWRTGQRIHNKINCPLFEKTEGGERFWSVCCFGRDNENNRFDLKIRSELQQAFDETKILENIDLYENKELSMSNLNKNLTTYINLLESNKNLIFHGAPGTGKTYLAKQIAQSLGAEWKMVQFHPSYDYTDFVEGLRPVKNSESNQINFERKDGVFKSFCKKALKNWNDSKKTNENLKEEYSLAAAFSDLCEKIQSGEITKLELRNGDFAEIQGVNDDLTSIYIKSKNSSVNEHYTVSSNRLSKLAEIYKTIEELDSISNIYKSVTAAIGGCQSSYYWATLRTLYEIRQTQNQTDIEIKVEEKKYVFIIDEINRGELSKIFGELFFCVEPSYRGIKGKIQTQYQNLVESGDLFEEGFFIPENVYIIGTMNDIDRSVECMDFAMRRRFTFVEITAEESAENMELSAISKRRMKNLNSAIEEIGLDSSFHIGASYFKNVEDNAKDGKIDYESLWKQNLKPLLQEYLRGNDTRKIEELEKAYTQCYFDRSEA